MIDEGRQPELFSLDPPPPARPSCPQCGETAVVVRYGVTVCTVCRYGVESLARAERAAAIIARGRAKHLQQARRRRR